MRNPTQCAVWKHPEIATRPLAEGFESVETFVFESHFWRYLLRCRECGQLYFFEFVEEVDWANGDDAQFTTYIPVDTPDEIESLKNATPSELMGFFPRLHKDHRTGVEGTTIRWIEHR